MYVKHLSRVAAGAAVAVALSVGLSACGSHSNTSKSNGAGAGAGGPVVAQAGQGARLSGTYSADDFWNWVPSTLFPSSLTQVPDGEYKTGTVVRVNDQYDLSSMSCTDALQKFGGPGFGEEAYLLDEGQNSGGSALYEYAVYEFASADQASQFVQAAAAKFSSCGTFSVQGNPVTLGLGSASETNVPAADAVADLRESATINGSKLASDMVVSADGNVVLLEAGTANNGTTPNLVNLDQVSQATLAAFAAAEAQAVADHAPSDVTTSTAAPTLAPGDRIAGDAP